MTVENAKRSAAAAALEMVAPEMTLGLGTGSTAKHFVDLLGKKVREGLYVRAIPTSNATKKQALSLGIECIEPDETTIIDLAVDGTDEIDGRLNLIKGGGGAHLREKIIAAAARDFIVIADDSKKVSDLGAYPLPLEIESFSWPLTVQMVRKSLTELGYNTPNLSFRPSEQGMFQSDGGHFILDCSLGRIKDAEILDEKLRSIPGVIETGLFVGMVTKAYIANTNGSVDTLT